MLFFNYKTESVIVKNDTLYVTALRLAPKRTLVVKEKYWEKGFCGYPCKNFTKYLCILSIAKYTKEYIDKSLLNINNVTHNTFSEKPHNKRAPTPLPQPHPSPLPKWPNLYHHLHFTPSPPFLGILTFYCHLNYNITSLLLWTMINLVFE